MSEPSAAESERRGRLARIGFGIAAVGFSARAIGAAAFWFWLPAPDFARHCLLACLLWLLAVRLVRTGHVDAAIFLAGLEWTLYLVDASATFGVHADFELMVPVLAVSVLMYGHLSFRIRVAMAVAPVAIYLPLRLLAEDPAPMVRLGESRLAILSAANFILFSLVTILITASMVRMAESARRRAEEVGEARTQLIADLSHELRTPAATSLAAAQAALRHATTLEECHELFGVVDRGARAIGGIVERMLELASLDRGEKRAVLREELGASVRKIVDEFRPLAAERDIRFEIREAPIDALTDETLLRIVLGNLLANAIRFSPAGGKVEVGIAEGPAITVRDEGPGIAATDLPKIFDRFWRADPSRSRKGGNYGLGLSIAKEYAAILGARLEVTSEPGRGAAFTIRW